MKLYYCFTKSHLILKEQWFLPSIKDDYEIICEEHEQDCDSGVYMKAGWVEAIKKKVDLIIRAIEENWGKYLFIVMSIFSFLNRPKTLF